MAVGGLLLWFGRPRKFLNFEFWILDFEFVSDFEYRISIFLFGCGRRPR